MKPGSDFSAVQDEEVVASAIALRERLVTDSRIPATVIEKNGWVAVPVESGEHFSPEDIGRLAQAISSLGHASFLAVLTEELRDMPRVYSVQATLGGLGEFNWELGPFAALLTEPTESFAVLCTKNDHFVVAGREGFVTGALGLDLEAARLAFEEFASDLAWPAAVRAELKAVAAQYTQA